MSATHDARDGQVTQTTNFFMVGLLFGAAAGAAAGLLMATKPGKQLRGDLAESARRLRSRASDTYHQASQAMAKGREAFKKSRTSFDDVRARYDVDTEIDTTADHPY